MKKLLITLGVIGGAYLLYKHFTASTASSSGGALHQNNLLIPGPGASPAQTANPTINRIAGGSYTPPGAKFPTMFMS